MVKSIALDARPLISPLSGVARVIAEVLQNMPDSGKLKFRLYANRPCHQDFQYLLDLQHIEWHQSTGLLAKKGGLWYNIGLPCTLRKKDHRPDLFWASQQILPPFLSKNVPVVMTYYDLVLYKFPGAMRRLARWQQRLFQSMSVHRSDHILSISRQTMDDMCSHFAYPHNKAGVSLLGYKKGHHNNKDVLALKELLGFQPRNNYILAVSTIEPRKNYSTLLEAWALYARNHKQPLPLVIAGRKGWETPDFFKRLAALEQQFGDQLVILSGLDDTSIDALYSHCQFFCMPSLYEGFGLPVLEALAHKKTGLVSDLPCFHEIGSDYVRYLEADDIPGWADAIEEFSAALNRKKHIKKGKHLKGQSQAGNKNLNSQKSLKTKSFAGLEGLTDPAKFPIHDWSWQRTARIHYDTFCHMLGV